MAESDRTGGILTIDLGAVAANWRLLRDRAAPAECAAVVKADAYGLGMAEVAPALAAAGCRVFFVATLDEGIRLRSVLSARATGAEFPPPAAPTIFLLNGAPRGYEAELLQPFVESLALEVSRALQFFFTSTQFSQIDHIVLSGGCAVLPGADEAVAARTQINTILANPFAGMVLGSQAGARSKGLLADASMLMVACGLALRRFDE